MILHKDRLAIKITTIKNNGLGKFSGGGSHGKPLCHHRSIHRFLHKRTVRKNQPTCIQLARTRCLVPPMPIPLQLLLPKQHLEQKGRPRWQDAPQVELPRPGSFGQELFLEIGLNVEFWII